MQPTTRRKKRAAASTLVLLLLAACGGGGESEGPAAAPSRAESSAPAAASPSAVASASPGGVTSAATIGTLEADAPTEIGGGEVVDPSAEVPLADPSTFKLKELLAKDVGGAILTEVYRAPTEGAVDGFTAFYKAAGDEIVHPLHIYETREGAEAQRANLIKYWLSADFGEKMKLQEEGPVTTAEGQTIGAFTHVAGPKQEILSWTNSNLLFWIISPPGYAQQFYKALTY